MTDMNVFTVEANNKASYRGCIDKVFREIEEVQLSDPVLWSRFVQQFREDADYDAKWRGEYWGKLMRGACFVYSYTRSKALYDILTDTIREILECEDEEGRISSYAKEHEFDGWDIWGRKYVLLGMQYFYEICTDEELRETLVSSMCRQADYIISKIGDKEDGKLPITKATRHWRGLNSSSLLEPIVRLYKLTKVQKYLDFAAYIVGCGATDIVNIFELAYDNELYPYQYPVTKAYEMMSCFSGLLEYYHITGKEEYRTSIINFADRILESDFTIIGCCGCTHELFDHSAVRQANTTNGTIMQETCVTVTLMKFLYELTLLTGDSKYVDAFEVSLYNAYLGAVNTEHVIERKTIQKYPDWELELEPLPFDSYSPLTAGTRGNAVGGVCRMSDNHYYGCCACIGAMGIGLVPKLAVLSSQNGPVINLYTEGRVLTQTPSGNLLKIITETAYPAAGRVEITLEAEEAEHYELLFRIPHWSQETRLFLNGREQSVEPGYTHIAREWKSGDTIHLEFDMRTEAVYPTPYGSQVLMNRVIWGANYVIPTYDEEDSLAKNHLALRRGPIILAQENRLGYSVDDAVDIIVEADGYVSAIPAEKEIAPYPHLLEMEIPLADGSRMHVTDYASAGKLWTEESKMAAWILTTGRDTNDTA